MIPACPQHQVNFGAMPVDRWPESRSSLISSGSKTPLLTSSAILFTACVMSHLPLYPNARMRFRPVLSRVASIASAELVLTALWQTFRIANRVEPHIVFHHCWQFIAYRLYEQFHQCPHLKLGRAQFSVEKA
jgi:hypothetical protein